MTEHNHSPFFLEDQLQQTFLSSHLSKPEWAVCFASFHRRRRHRHLLCHKTIHNPSPPVGLRPLDQARVSRVFQRSHVLSCTHHTKFDVGHVQMQHGVQPQACSAHVRLQQHWGFIINAFVRNLVFDGHDLQLCFWLLRRRVAVSLTHACRRSYPRSCRRPLACCFSCVEHNYWSLRVLPFCWIFLYPIVGAILKIQTYCTNFLNNPSLNELFNLSRKHAVVRDDVAPVRVF